MNSAWWDGDRPVTQPWGKTDVEVEPYDPRFPGWPHTHQGIDIGWFDPNDQRWILKAGQDLTVRTAYITASESLLILELGDKEAWCFHMAEHYVVAGQAVVKGTSLGRIGDIGLAEGCHLHFELRPAGTVFYRPYNTEDPAAYLSNAAPAGTPQEVDLTPEQAASLAHLEEMVGALVWVYGDPAKAYSGQGEALARIREADANTAALLAAATQLEAATTALQASLDGVSKAVQDMRGQVTQLQHGGDKVDPTPDHPASHP